jgi:hypothetical protein
MRSELARSDALVAGPVQNAQLENKTLLITIHAV